jgi:hypothetical protein
MISCPAFLLYWFAKRRRSLGYYDNRTLSMFYLHWRRRGTKGALFRYLLFRRDLGLPLSEKKSTRLLESSGFLRSGYKFLTLAMLLESRVADVSVATSVQVERGGRRMAPLASLEKINLGSTGHPWLASIEHKQEQWRQSFKTQILEAARICVVGNSYWLNGAGLGEQIDANDLVIRFNRFSGPASATADLGQRLDVWSTSPGLAVAPPDAVPWVIVTGPDVRYRLQSWERFQARLEHGKPVLTIPLLQWRELVGRLSAPPSAGLLILAWIRAIRGSWHGIQVTGFGGAVSGLNNYHHADPGYGAASRHNWAEEEKVLFEWQGEGLAMLLPEKRQEVDV